MSFSINDGAVAPVAHVFSQEQAQQGKNIPALFLDRSPALGPKSFIRLEATSRFATGAGPDITQLHLYAPHFTDPGDGVIQMTGALDAWFNINSRGTASVESIRKLFGMLLVNAMANTTIRDSAFQVKPLVG